MNALRELARAAGLDVEDANWRGEPTSASDEAVLPTLRALAPELGVRIEGVEDTPHALAMLERERWNQIVPPVVIGCDGTSVVPYRPLLRPSTHDVRWSAFSDAITQRNLWSRPGRRREVT